MTSSVDRTAHFLTLHRPGRPLLLPNPWDAGSARILASLGFQALATTSSGHAATLGRRDGSVTRAEALAHAAELVAAVEVPVSADLEHGFDHDPEGVAATVREAVATGLAGCSIEDSTGRADDPIYDAPLAAERVRAAAEAAHDGDVHLVLTARSEGFLHGRSDLGEAIARLQSFQEAGADVLFAPGVRDLNDIRTVVHSVDLPVNVILAPGAITVADLAEVGVARISVGGSLAYIALGALVEAAGELLEQGSYSFADRAASGRDAVRSAFPAAPPS